MSENQLPTYEGSFNPEDYLPLLALDILEKVSKKDMDSFFRDFKSLYHMIAHDMVRYAVQNNDSATDDKTLINEVTGEPYKLADLGFDAESLAGDTAGSFIRRDHERVQHIPLIAIALYRAVNS